jgi:pyridoxine 5-phosphate synthase
VAACVRAGAQGITVHPRADERHITARDVRDISEFLQSLPSPVELNVEGDPRPDLLELVRAVRPTQCTLVPVRPGEITSQAGWTQDAPSAGIVGRAVRELKQGGVRVSLFVDPAPEPIRWAATLKADRVELYTEPFARAFERGKGPAHAAFDEYARAATVAHELGMAVNAGHDLDLDNLVLFRELPHLAEVSIGHALVSRALFVGLEASVREYLQVIALAPGSGGRGS